jgi:hypothetical protein
MRVGLILKAFTHYKNGDEEIAGKTVVADETCRAQSSGLPTAVATLCGHRADDGHCLGSMGIPHFHRDNAVF